MTQQSLDDITTDTASSNITPIREEQIEILINDVIKLNNDFWAQESPNMHQCYKQGNVYANDTAKKNGINLISDMFHLLKDVYKKGVNDTQQIDIIFDNIENSLKLLNTCENNVDKICLLSIIQGYTLGCIKKYEKETQ